MQANAHTVFNETPDNAKAKQLKKAHAACCTALQKKPNDITYLHVLGLIDCQLGRLPDAKKWFEKAMAVQPDFIEAQFHYGLVLMEERKYADAEAMFKRVITRVQNNADVYYHLGNALLEGKKPNEAVIAYRQALVLRPDYVEALNNLGNILHDQGKLDEAIESYERALVARPSYVMPHNNIGLILVKLGRLDEAEAHYREAIRLHPTYMEAHNNLGIVCRLKGQFDESKSWYQKALALKADYPEALNNLGNACKDCGQMEDAIAYYEKALRLKDSHDYRHNLSLAHLAVGRFEEGWRSYESRWQTQQLAPSLRLFNQPQWRGEPAEGRTLFIHAEQGFGDTLQFCRYAPLAKALGFKVIMEVQPALLRLTGSLEGVDQLIARGAALPDFDLHCPMMSLPTAFKTQIDTIPARIPYLAAEEQTITKWRERLSDAKGKLRVGLVWAGSGRTYSPDLTATDRRRSMTPELLAPLLDVPNVQFYSLQKTGAQAPVSFGLIDYMADCMDFADTAALVANLDLVISVDTAMVHLAGALGKPVWVLNRFDSCWRWLQNRDDSPWYPALRLFTQSYAGDWGGVITRVCTAITNKTELKTLF